eukprot:TRINITY_DN55619_c0_g1_i1.p1 TRINITY_DN55619_c0_g1~~TRINITY_DN55619_c0_g1_i1.p1  ORF type:complete len:142 (-),score=20.51 TRINITY_DN55619_c0_g1_i1:17-403(-)
MLVINSCKVRAPCRPSRWIHASRFCSIQLPPATCKISNLDGKRRKLLWQSRTRGWLETNQLLGDFVERQLPGFTDTQAKQLDELLARSDAELFSWISGQAAVPKEMLDNEVMVMLLRYINRDHPALRS